MKRALEDSNNFGTPLSRALAAMVQSRIYATGALFSTPKVMGVGKIVGQRHFELTNTITQSQQLQLFRSTSTPKSLLPQIMFSTMNFTNTELIIDLLNCLVPSPNKDVLA